MWSDIPNLRHLRAFVAVVQTGGVGRAAEKIHLSQPAISQALAHLETRLGVKLLDYSGAGKTPTAIGKTFFERVIRALDWLALGARDALAGEPRKTGGGFARFDNLITVSQLRALSAMAMSGNFSLAAREIGLSQPSIHRAARDLERLSGLPLFVATPQGIALTRAAETLARNASLALAEFQQGLAEVAETLGLDSGSIVVGSLPLARTQLLPDAINRLAAERPRTGVRIIAAPYDGLLHRLRHGIIDFVIGALRDPPPIGDVTQERLFDDLLAVIARPGHPLAGKAVVSRADLLSHAWVVPVEETPTRAVFHRMFSAADIAAMPGGLVEASALTLVRGVLRGSDRLAILSARQVREEIDLGFLIELSGEIPGGRRPIGLTFRRDWRPTATQARFLAHIRELASYSQNQ